MVHLSRIFWVVFLCALLADCRSKRRHGKDTFSRAEAEKACADQGKELDIINFDYTRDFQCKDPIDNADLPCVAGAEVLCPDGYLDGCGKTAPSGSKPLTTGHLCVRENSIGVACDQESTITCRSNEVDTCQDKRSEFHACYLK